MAQSISPKEMGRMSGLWPDKIENRNLGRRVKRFMKALQRLMGSPKWEAPATSGLLRRFEDLDWLVNAH